MYAAVGRVSQTRTRERNLDRRGTVPLATVTSQMEVKAYLWGKIQEDIILEELVAEYGLKSWSFIARQLVGRTGKQCRER